MPRLAAFSLIEMMIAIVILGLGLVMTATMFPVAWTRARTLTEYTTQQAVAGNAATALTQSLRASGASFANYFDNSGPLSFETGRYFLAGGSLAGDLFYDPVFHNDPRVTCIPPGGGCFVHRAVLIPSDTRVHALNMQNLIAGSDPDFRAENPYQIERVNERNNVREDLCQQSNGLCRTNYPTADPPMACLAPRDGGAQFCARSFYSWQIGIGARMYPPLDAPPDPSASDLVRETWLERFHSRRYSYGVLHRLRRPVGPTAANVWVDGVLPYGISREIAAQAASAVGTTRSFDFYLVTLKRPQPTSRYAVQDWNTSPVTHTTQLAAPAPLSDPTNPLEMSLPVPWRVQIEVPANLRYSNGAVATPADPSDDPTGVPTEVQVPPSGFMGSAELLIGMFPNGTQFVDEINGQVYRIVRRRVSFDTTGNPTSAILTLDREVFVQDFDNGPDFPNDGVLQIPYDVVRTVWVYPPPIAEVTGTSIVFDDASPVVGIDVRTISVSPPG